MSDFRIRVDQWIVPVAQKPQSVHCVWQVDQFPKAQHMNGAFGAMRRKSGEECAVSMVVVGELGQICVLKPESQYCRGGKERLEKMHSPYITRH
jgi:hypothetical protein